MTRDTRRDALPESIDSNKRLQSTQVRPVKRCLQHADLLTTGLNSQMLDASEDVLELDVIRLKQAYIADSSRLVKVF